MLAFGITIGMNSGLIRPFMADSLTPRNSRAPSSAVSSPPKPVPTTVATREASTSGDPASRKAASAALSVNCVTRSARRASFGDSTVCAPKSVTSHPKRTGDSDMSTRSMVRATVRAPTIVSQNDSGVDPAALTMPMPVIATRSCARIGSFPAGPSLPVV